jgi:hypothetical protein
MGRISNVGPTTLSSPVPMKNGVFIICSRVTCNAVAIPVVMKAVETRYVVIAGSKLKAPEAMASGGETMDPIMVRAC